MKNFLDHVKENDYCEKVKEVNKSLRDFGFSSDNLKETNGGVLYLEREKNIAETKIKANDVLEKNNEENISSGKVESQLNQSPENNSKNMLEGPAGIDKESFPGHIIVRNGKGKGFILMNKNIHQIDENGNVKKHFTFDEAQKIALEWYHVPSVEEWKQLIYIYLHDIKGIEKYNLGEKYKWKREKAREFASSLELPLAGCCRGFDDSVRHQGLEGHYWSSSPLSADARHLYFHSSSVRPQTNYCRAHRLSVRCFKN